MVFTNCIIMCVCGELGWDKNDGEKKGLLFSKLK